MHATIRKMSKQVDKLQQDVEDAKDKLDAAKRKVKKKYYFENSVILKTMILRGEEMEALILCLTSPKYTALYIML